MTSPLRYLALIATIPVRSVASCSQPLRARVATKQRVRVREWTVTKGDVWPLEAGEKFTYAYTSTDRKGKRSKGKFQCSVGKPTKVSVPAGDFDTIPVACRVPRLTRTYYLSPALGMPVKYQAKNVTSEMVSFTAGQGLNK